jgi:hypothetical protein
MPRIMNDTLTLDCGCVGTLTGYGEATYQLLCEEHDPTSVLNRYPLLWAPFADVQDIEWF